MFEPADFIDLVCLVERTGQKSQEIFEDFEAALQELSFAYQGLDSEGRLEPSSGYPGYLEASCDPWQVFVPWSLVSCFPRSDLLREVLALGETVAIHPVDNFCVSGSAALLGEDMPVADIDFCQYCELSPLKILRTVQENTMSSTSPRLIRASYGQGEEKVFDSPPWSEWERLEDAAIDSIDGAERLIFDFIAEEGHFRTMPTSMVALASDFSDRLRGAASRSFVFQEIIAIRRNAKAQPLWDLADPQQFANYLNMLRNQIAEYSESNPIKAVKRVLSFALTVRMFEFSDRAIDILASKTVHQMVAASHQSENRGTATPSRLLDVGISQKEEMLTESSHYDLDGLSNKDLPQRCRNLAAMLLSKIEELERQRCIGN